MADILIGAYLRRRWPASTTRPLPRDSPATNTFVAASSRASSQVVLPR